ncbi:hypothetical protein HOE04_02050 [archaeon]|jgi:deoxyribonuclease-1-like protein|nr:hypothetical protein [archaeon]
MAKKLLFTLIFLLVIGIGSFFYLIPSDTNTITGNTIRIIEEQTENTKDFIEETKEEFFEDGEDEEEQEKDDDKEEKEVIDEPEPNSQNIKIANFNAQIFGDSKWGKLGSSFFVPLIEDYDIFFLQEIRDKDGSSFNTLCSSLEDYDCQISQRAGQSTSKEQYGVIYKKSIEATLTDYTSEYQDEVQRPPLKVEFLIDDYELTAWNYHTSPDSVEEDINLLENLVEDSGNVLIIGDFNLDCSYDDGKAGDFVDWNYLIEDGEDTTVSQTDCAYDRIIINDDMNEEYVDDGIYTEITKEQSDHYLVWVEIEL